jgi:hypothetical protein
MRREKTGTDTQYKTPRLSTTAPSPQPMPPEAAAKQKKKNSPPLPDTPPKIYRIFNLLVFPGHAVAIPSLSLLRRFDTVRLTKKRTTSSFRRAFSA